MGKLTRYFNHEEEAWIKAQKPAILRELVQEKMDKPREIVRPLAKGDGLNTCRDCGAVLPYYKGKCKNC